MSLHITHLYDSYFRSSIVHVNGFKQWQFILDTWLDSAYGEFAVTKQTISVWRELLGDFIPETHTFLQHIGRDVLQCGMTFIEKVRAGVVIILISPHSNYYESLAHEWIYNFYQSEERLPLLSELLRFSELIWLYLPYTSWCWAEIWLRKHLQLCA